MKKKIFRNVSVLASLLVLFSFFLTILTGYKQTVDHMKLGVQNEARYVKEALTYMGEDFLTQAVANASTNRLTFIDADGTVLYDSNKEAAEMENHEDRPEIMAALQNETGEDSRVSATLGSLTYYYAIRLDNNQVIRVSATIESLWKTMALEIIPIVVVILFVLIISLVVTGKLTDKIIQPINNLNLEHPLENDVYEEITPLLRRIHKQNQVIESQVDELSRVHQEYVAITDNMKDGLIVTNRQSVLSINKSAQKIYKIDEKRCIGKNIVFVSRDESLKKVWEQAVQGNSCESVIEKDGKTYHLRANPVLDQTEVIGTVILILDETEKKQAEKRRKEFSANVSHELKTPLMSISGYAELMRNNLVQEKDIPEFSDRIYTEACRLTSLVEDIIRLSQLDEINVSTTDMEYVDLYDITKDVHRCLEFSAESKGVRIVLNGSLTIVRGVRSILYEMIYNLCDNAIKYNRKNGLVKIDICDVGDETIISVKDNGIGIAWENQDRIFERFYRVDKSHSRETGGTGLGLSIVKHGAKLHGAKIEVDSELGKGTQISLRFFKLQ